ncbi:MAG: hypothetical protein KDK70_25020 [Myxococcales bacterium]|nr:hypothetical protein [Myxococcales bacterium]
MSWWTKDLILEFRKKMFTDEKFRAKFVSDPTGTLRAMGAKVPDGVEIPAPSLKDLEARVAEIKKSVGDQKVTDLWATDGLERLEKAGIPTAKLGILGGAKKPHLRAVIESFKIVDEP